MSNNKQSIFSKIVNWLKIKKPICPNCKTELEQEGNQWFNKINIYICPKCKKQWI